MFKFLLVIMALAAAAPSQSEAQLLDSVGQLNELLKRLLEMYDNIQDLVDSIDLGEFDMGQVIAGLTTPENMTKLFEYILDNFAGNLRPEYSCLLRVVIETDAETQEEVREFIQELVNYVRLVRERDAKKEECDNIDTSTVLGIVAERNCRLHQANLEAHVNLSYARLSNHVIKLRATLAEGFSCLRT